MALKSIETWINTQHCIEAMQSSRRKNQFEASIDWRHTIKNRINILLQHMHCGISKIYNLWYKFYRKFSCKSQQISLGLTLHLLSAFKAIEKLWSRKYADQKQEHDQMKFHAEISNEFITHAFAFRVDYLWKFHPSYQCRLNEFSAINFQRFTTFDIADIIFIKMNGPKKIVLDLIVIVSC